MNRSLETQSSTRTPAWWVMRVVWGALAAMHLWPFAALVFRLFATPSISDALWLTSLVGVIAVFSLKAVDSARLRFHRPGIEFTVFVVVAAMIHGDVVMPRDLPTLAVETTTVAVLAAGGAVITNGRLRRRVSELLRGLARRSGTSGHGHRPVGLVRLESRRCPNRVAMCCASARAPPPLIF